MEEWTSDGVVSMADVTNRWFLGGAGVFDVFWVKSQRTMSSISSLMLTSKISSITSVMVESF